MKRWRRFTGLLLAVSALAGAPCLAQSLSVRADYWYPVNGEPDAERPGFAIEILRAIFQPLGIAVDYRLSGWSRSLEMAHIGQIDCVVGAYAGDAPELLYPATAMAVDDTAMYVVTGNNWRYQGLSSLDGLTVGVIADYSYGEQMDAYLAGRFGDPLLQYLHGKHPLERNVQKLLAGRVDVLIESPLVMEAMLGGSPHAGKLVEAGRMNLRQRIYVACSPARDTSAQILTLFDQGMEKLHRQGELRRIMARYGLDPAVYEWSLLVAP
ncbi:MAG: substrate-binding periplasmic protein [Alcanivoracaceae bacterium]